MRELAPLDGDVVEVDGRGKCAIPGLVDCHTHACFGGDRVEEFALRARGASYEELHAAGGGILSTVGATRAAGEEGLRDAVRRHLDWMRRAGTTTAEAKSGYGLDRETELASLRAIRAEGAVPTFLGAHAVPPEFDDGDAYVDFLIAEVLPQAAPLAEAADVFLERGAFDAAQARRYLRACAEEGLALRLHGDQFTESGAIPLAIELGARSVDHLEATGDAGVRALAASEVAGVLLPASALFLARPMPPARALIDAGAAVALATDFNPGSAFCESLPLVCSLAATQLAMSVEEALAACTVNAAHVLGRAGRKGRIAARLRRGHRPARRSGLAVPRVPPGRAGRGGDVRRWTSSLGMPQPEDLAGVRGLIEEYVRSLGVDLGFQEIETELSDLAAAYAPPAGRDPRRRRRASSSRAASPCVRSSPARAR